MAQFLLLLTMAFGLYQRRKSPVVPTNMRETTYAYLILRLGKHVLLKEPFTQLGKVLEVNLRILVQVDPRISC